MIDLHHWLDTLFEGYIAYILTMEYYFGRSDTDLKKEEKRKRAKAVVATPLPHSSGTKDLAVGPSTQACTPAGASKQGDVVLREMCRLGCTCELCNKARSQSSKD